MKYDSVCLRHTNQLCSQNKSLRLRFISVLVPTLRQKGNIQESQWLRLNIRLAMAKVLSAKQLSKRQIAPQVLNSNEGYIRRRILDT